MDFDNRWFGDCHSTFSESDHPRLTGTPDACYLEVADGTLIWHADEHRLIYCAPYTQGGRKYRETPGRQATIHERLLFLAVSAALMMTFGLWTGARALVRRSLMGCWEGTKPGDYTGSKPAQAVSGSVLREV